MLPLTRPSAAVAASALRTRLLAPQGILHSQHYASAFQPPSWSLVRGIRTRTGQTRYRREGRKTWDEARFAKKMEAEANPMNNRNYRKEKEREDREKERERSRRATADFQAEMRGDPTAEGFGRAKVSGKPKVRVDTPTGRMKTIPAAASFVKVGVNANLAALITQQFPSIRAPTPTQAVLIPTMMQKPRTDMILRAQTGNGKSFGTLLSLLSQPRLKIKTTLGGKPLEQRLDRTWDRSQARRGAEGIKAQKAAAHHNRHSGGTRRSDGALKEEEQEDPGVLTRPVVSALIIVPSNDLAYQYRDWARHFMPQPDGPLTQLDSILQVLARKDLARSDKDQLKVLRETPPHILVATPSRLREILDDRTIKEGGRSILGLRTLRTLVLDEVDALFELPGMYPTEKQVWHMEHHLPVGVTVMNDIMRIRPTMSGGPGWSGAGMEKFEREDNGSRSVPVEVRGQVHEGTRRALAKHLYATPLPRSVVDQKGVFIPPLQLVAISATANSVLRHFLGGRTGWLRIGQLDRDRFTGQWIDLTGQTRMRFGAGNLTDLSSGLFKLDPTVRHALEVGTMPREIDHYCLVVDETKDGHSAHEETIDTSKTPLPGVRNMFLRPFRPKRALPDPKSKDQEVSKRPNPPKRSRKPNPSTTDPTSLEEWETPETDEFMEAKTYLDMDKDSQHTSLEEQQAIISVMRKRPKVVPAYKSTSPGLDYDLVETAAYVYASVAAGKSAIIVPMGWSQPKVIKHLQSIGVPAQVYLPWVPPDTNRSKVAEKPPASSSLHAGVWSKERNSQPVYVLTSDQARGIHIPDLSHIFILTSHAVKSAPQYTHLAGRAARLRTAHSSEVDPAAREAERQIFKDENGREVLGPSPVAFGRPHGQVYTIIRGVPADAQGWSIEERMYAPLPGEPTVVSAEELCMSGVLGSLGIKPKKFPLTLPDPAAVDGQPESSPLETAQASVSDSEGTFEGKPESRKGVYDLEEDWKENYQTWEKPPKVDYAAEQKKIQAHLEARRRAQADAEAEHLRQSRKRARSVASSKEAADHSVQDHALAGGLEPGAEEAQESHWTGEDPLPTDFGSTEERLPVFDFGSKAQEVNSEFRRGFYPQKHEPTTVEEVQPADPAPRRRRCRAVSAIAALESIKK